MRKNETPEEVREWFRGAVEKLWPIAFGSVSLRKSPCIRENCPACRAGIGHSSYALSGYRGRNRFSIYVSGELAQELQRAVENGRRLQELMKEAGIRYVRAQKGRKNSTSRK